MVSNAEIRASASLRAALRSVPVGASLLHAAEFAEFLSSLEVLVPALLAELYPYWQGESLDGFAPASATRTTVSEAEFIGLCWLISDQSLTPVHIRARCSESADEIEWMRCRLGVPGDGRGGLLRLPASGSRRLGHRVAEDPDSYDWVFTMTVGQEARA